MDETYENRRYSYVAATAYALLSLNQLVYLRALLQLGAEWVDFLSVLPILIYLGFTIFLFWVNKKRGLLLVAVARISLALTYFLTTFYWPHLVAIAAGGALVHVIVLALKEDARVQERWWLPPLLLGVHALIRWFRVDIFRNFQVYDFIVYWDSMEVIGFYFMSLWLKKDNTIRLAAKDEGPEYSKLDQ